MKRNIFSIFKLFNFYILAAALLLTSCSDMLETESELVEYDKDNTLNHPTDSVHSVLGIVNKLQFIADRTQLLGEVRGDLTTVTDAASADLKRLAAFNLAEGNKYNQVSDYYAVINNCNYYLAHVDTAMERRGHNLFLAEYAAVKTFRAWTYMQLAQAYGQVPLVLTPVMTEPEARAAMNQPRVGIDEICDYFIKDLTPYAGVELPRFGAINSMDSQKFFYPLRVMLGDLCLWAGRYREAATWYHDYLTDPKQPLPLLSTRSVWPNPTEFTSPRFGYVVTNMGEVISYIPMEQRVFDGVVSDLDNIYESTRENSYYYSLTPSRQMRRLSADQIYCIEYKTATRTDTLYAPRAGFSNSLYAGDLRLCSNFRVTSMGGQSDYSEYNSEYQTMNKVTTSMVPMCRCTMVYLRYAEALNRAGLPQSAMVVLKYGPCEKNFKAYVDSLEQAKAGALINFEDAIFTRETVIGVHSRGSGDSQANPFYVLPQPATQLATRQDTIDYQVPLVENMIIDEMALEGAFEGYRFYDLMRVAMRRGDAAYLADPVSRRNGEVDDALRTLLMDSKNWYLPLP